MLDAFAANANNLTLKEFLQALLSSFTAAGIPFSILRNHRNLPSENVGSDIDFLVRSCDLPLIANILHRMPQIRITDILARRYVTSFFVDGVAWGDGKRAIELDFCSSLSWKGLAYLQVEDVLECSCAKDGDASFIVVPSEIHEAINSFLSSYLIGGFVKERYQEQVRHVFQSRTAEVTASLAGPFGSDLSRRLVAAVVADDRAKLHHLRFLLCLTLLWTSMRRATWRAVSAMLRHYYRELQICIRGEAVKSICILGPDGVGKSTIMLSLQEQLHGATKVVKLIHLRPGLFSRKRSGCSAIDPHAAPPRNALISSLKIILWVLELWIDRFANGHRNATLRLWDRYFHDLLVDTKRYRYGGPTWFARLVSRLVPQPDLWILLDAPAEVIQARKSEVPLAETKRQLEAYRRVVSGLPNHVVVDASRSPREVLRSVEDTIFCFMTRQVEQRLSDLR